MKIILVANDAGRKNIAFVSDTGQAKKMAHLNTLIMSRSFIKKHF